MNKKLIGFALSICIIAICFAGCGEKDDCFYHSYSFKCTPCNQTQNGSGSYSVILPFRVPEKDPTYFVNKTIFSPDDLDIEIVKIHETINTRYLSIHCRSNETMSFTCRYDSISRFYVYLNTDGPFETFSFSINGSFESYDIDYSEYEQTGTESNLIKKEASYTGVCYNGENRVDTEYTVTDPGDV